MLFLRAFHLKCTLTYLNISDRLGEEIDCSCCKERSRKTKALEKSAIQASLYTQHIHVILNKNGVVRASTHWPLHAEHPCLIVLYVHLKE